MAGSFVHLHVHSEYSLLDGANRTGKLVKRVAELKQPAIALTDHGVMYGALEFYCKAKENGVKPIIGCELYVCRDRKDRTSHGKASPNRTYHLIALVKNRVGYQNLVKIVSTGHLEGYYYKPRVDYETLEKYSEGLIFLSGCLGSEIPQHILKDDIQAAYERARYFKQLKGDDFYLELQDHGFPEQKKVNEALIGMSRELDLKLVASNDAHYTCFEDYKTHDALVCIQSGKLISDPNKLYKSDQFFIKSADEMAEIFGHVPEALTNTLEIASKCNLIIELGRPQLPQYPLPPNHTEASYLSELTWKGARKRYPDITPEIEARLKYELDMMERMGFPGYFLIVWDFIAWAKEQGIEVGPGRGSAAGSIVAYCLGITDIDPLPYNLLFERFLNPERVSMPDIDVDFCIERRGEVIKYVQEKYGHDKVAQIVTFGTLGAKAAIKDTGRVLEFPFADTNKLCKMVPPELGINLEDATKEGTELDAASKADPQVGNLISMARKLEGYVRNTGIHAAGVVISRDPLDTIVPLQRPSKDESGLVSTQYEQKYLEMMGLLKMDFLGLRNLTMIAKALKFIDQFHGVKIDWAQVPMDDPKTYDLLRAGDAIGIFQLESEGMRKLVMRLQPSNFEDLAALLALYRPGPLQSGMVDDFINRKHGRAEIEYPHDSLIPILKDTYGTCLTGDTLVTDAISGKPLRLDAVRQRDHLLVQGVDAQMRPAVARVTHFFDQGVKDVFRLTLQNGATIRATADHRFLTPQGWVELHDLAEGALVGTPLAEHRFDEFVFRASNQFTYGSLRAFEEVVNPNETAEVALAPEDELGALEQLSRARWVEVAGIEPAGRENVYDITVEGIHNFVANGMLVHNCIYQEQVMLIAQIYAGYSLGQADLLRRAMGKKKPEEMAKQKEIFLDGAAGLGHPSEKAEALFDNLEKFAAYGFNKSHSAAYAVVTFRTAYLKAHYPVEYMCALLSSVVGTQEKVQLYIHNSNQMGIKVLPPDVNVSDLDFSVRESNIRFGLSAIKNVGVAAVQAIVEARERVGGQFTDLYHFCDEVDMKAVNKRTIESLIKCGAFDSTGAHRAQLLAALDDAVERAAKAQKEKGSGQISLFAMMTGTEDAPAFTMPKPNLPTLPPLSKEEELSFEKELIGVYVSGHPLQQFGDKLLFYSTHLLAAAEEIADSTVVVVGGLLTGTRKATTKKGLPMMSGRLEDLTGSVDVLFFPETYEKFWQLLNEDAKILVKGKFSNRDEEMKILASQVRALTHLPVLHLTLPGELNGGFLLALRNEIAKYPGDTPLVLHLGDSGEAVLAGEQFRVEPSEAMLFELKKILGPTQVRLEDPAPALPPALLG